MIAWPEYGTEDKAVETKGFSAIFNSLEAGLNF